MDQSVKLFNGDMTLHDLMNMPIEEFNDLISTRSEQRKKSLEKYRKTGEKDLYVENSDSMEQFMEILAPLLIQNSEFRNSDPRKIKQRRPRPNQTMGQKEFHQSGMKLYNDINTKKG